MSLDELRAFVAASRAQQGLPPVIEDDAVLDAVAAILRTDTEMRPAA